MAKVENPEVLTKKEKVRAAVPLQGVPEGTHGKVMLSVGLEWIRYWVRFANGVDLGSIDRHNLVRTKEWDNYLVQRDAAERAAEAVAEAGVAAPGGAPEEVAATGGGADAEVNGVTVPALLLARSAAARERLGA